jgi:alpha-mannosidase
MEKRDWPEWSGELYLELHRGTYTTQSQVKRFNRKLEFLLRRVEWLAVVSGEAARLHDALRAAWTTVLTNQFHDILPGSSIHRVYDEALASYARVEQELGAIAGDIADKLAKQTNAPFIILNDLQWMRTNTLTLDAQLLNGAAAMEGPHKMLYPVQYYTDMDGNKKAAFAPQAAPMGWTLYMPSSGSNPAAGAPAQLQYINNRLVTPFYKVKFDSHGRITSLICRENEREAVKADGYFNMFVTAEDIPLRWEAWDIDADWTDTMTEETRLESSEVVSLGLASFRLRQRYRIGRCSTLTQDVVFYSKDRRIDFETKVDWQEERRLLKVAFDTSYHSPQVRCEIPFGNLLRNTHRSELSDRAKFEICAHKWIALEEAKAGIALLNDCKYGHDVENGKLRLTLLRSPAAPDETADRGEHRFTYALLPFIGSFESAEVIRSAYELNSPLFSARGPGLRTQDAEFSFCTVSGSGVVIESVKQSERGAEQDGTVIRLYESLGGRVKTTLRFAREVKAAYTADMLEGHAEEIPFKGAAIELTFRSFEIKTLIVRF